MKTTAPMPTTFQTRKTKPWLLWIGGIVLLLLIAAGVLIARMNYVPTDLDYSTTRLSEQGMYKVGYTSDLGSVPVNQMQAGRCTWRRQTDSRWRMPLSPWTATCPNTVMACPPGPR